MAKILDETIIPSIKSKVNAKQDVLYVSGENQNIKTVNGEGLLGKGNIITPEFEVTTTDPGEGSPLASNKIIFVVAE